MEQNITHISDRHELAHRSSNGLDVSLLWTRSTNTVSVFVQDELYDEAFEIAVAPGESPLAVFTHPFAFAARQGIEYGGLEAAA
jgi:hypothetical protein